jgi:putative endonuclease
MLRCDDDTLYTGVTTDIERRFNEHVSGKLGAKYTRGRKPISVVYREICDSRSSAQIRESAIKRLTRSEKERLLVE